MTPQDALFLLGSFLFLLVLGGLWADAWFTTPDHEDARRRNPHVSRRREIR